MLDYIKCPSCSEIINYDPEQMYRERKNILNDNTLSESEKDYKDAQVIKKNGITKICCMIRVKTRIPYHEIVES